MKVAFTIAGKQQVSRRRENPTAGNVRHVESPAFAAGRRVNVYKRTRALCSQIAAATISSSAPVASMSWSSLPLIVLGDP